MDVHSCDSLSEFSNGYTPEFPISQQRLLVDIMFSFFKAVWCSGLSRLSYNKWLRTKGRRFEPCHGHFLPVVIIHRASLQIGLLSHLLLLANPSTGGI